MMSVGGMRGIFIGSVSARGGIAGAKTTPWLIAIAPPPALSPIEMSREVLSELPRSAKRTAEARRSVGQALPILRLH